MQSADTATLRPRANVELSMFSSYKSLRGQYTMSERTAGSWKQPKTSGIVLLLTYHDCVMRSSASLAIGRIGIPQAMEDEQRAPQQAGLAVLALK